MEHQPPYTDNEIEEKRTLQDYKGVGTNRNNTYNSIPNINTENNNVIGDETSNNNNNNNICRHRHRHSFFLLFRKKVMEFKLLLVIVVATLGFVFLIHYEDAADTGADNARSNNRNHDMLIGSFGGGGSSSSSTTSTNLDNIELWGKSSKGSKRNKKPTTTTLKEYQIPHYYNDQLVDHFVSDTETWSNRYYTSSKYWKGPGYPLFVIMGGEGPVDEVFYPFVYDDMAKEYGAYVLQTEHRFYGTSIPTESGGSAALPTNKEYEQLLSPDQALKDFIRITRHIQGQIGCSANRTSINYCPVISVGASYPGFLSAMMRFLYPDVIDMSYASSAPLLLYAQSRGTNVYFDYVTKIAEEGSPGCAEAYKTTLKSVYDEISKMSIHSAARELGICNNIPKYINSSKLLATELTMMVGFSNADFNMDYHPPYDPKTDVIKGCRAFQQKHKTPMERMADWLIVKAESGATDKPGEPCYDLHWDIPSGPNATITGADWSGMGDGDTANTWEFQCCKDLIIETGFGPNSMFLERPFDLDWLTEHCQARFQVNPQPTRMVDNWHFTDLVAEGASHILFTNGLQDAWSPLSYTEDLSDTILAVNLPSGAHHSDLNEYPLDQEWNDIIDGRKEVKRILGQWIDEVKQLSH